MPSDSANFPPTLRWSGDVNGHSRPDRSDRFPSSGVPRDRMPPGGIGLGGDSQPACAWSAGDRDCGGLRRLRGLQNVAGRKRRRNSRTKLDEVTQYLASSRPTAVNLFWHCGRTQRTLAQAQARPQFAPAEIAGDFWREARAIEAENRQMCRAIGRHGAELLAAVRECLTHCNAGGLATADYGRRWPSSSRPTTRERNCTFTPMRRDPCCKSAAHRLGNCSARH